MFLLAQIFGIFSTFAAILCVQARTAGGVLLGQILANGFSGLSYGLLGSLSGAWVCILASVHSVLISFIRKLDESRRNKLILLVSVVFAIAQEDASKMRNVMLISMSLWVFFDISVGAYTNIITHASTIVSIITAKIRLDKK
jgi:hypothetical protein